MKKILRKSKTIAICGLFIVAICCTIIVSKNQEKTVFTSAKTENISNKKICWGIKNGTNHSQPDVGSKNKELVNKYNGISLGNSEKKYIYLTFDLGYEAGYTNQILDSLKQENVNATFFITAHYVNTAGDILQRMIDEKQIVGNHTVNHKSMPDLSDEELKTEVMNLHQKVYEKYGYEMKYIRPPKGEFSERTLSLSEKLGYKTVMWSFAYVDWDEKNQPDEEKAIEKIISNLHNGEIMLLHATSKTNANIMTRLLQEIKAEGYEIKSLDNFEM